MFPFHHCQCGPWSQLLHPLPDGGPSSPHLPAVPFIDALGLGSFQWLLGRSLPNSSPSHVALPVCHPRVKTQARVSLLKILRAWPPPNKLTSHYSIQDILLVASICLPGYLQLSQSDAPVPVLPSATSMVLFIQFPFTSMSSPLSLFSKILTLLVDRSQIPPPLQCTFPDPPASFDPSYACLFLGHLYSALHYVSFLCKAC